MSGQDFYVFTGDLPDFLDEPLPAMPTFIFSGAKTRPQSGFPNYRLPPWVKPPADRMLPSHAGLLALIREAKDRGHIWADCALAELAIYTGIPYAFRRIVSFNREHYEIEVEKS
jgi:hypothetical protein